MKVVTGILNVLVLLFSSSAVYGAALNLSRIESSLIERIHVLCSYAQEAKEGGLNELENRVMGEIKANIEKEEAERNRWMRSIGLPESSLVRRDYLRIVAKATYFIELSKRVLQCIEARRISITTPTPYLNVCQTNQGPLGCAGQFTGLYKSRCVRPVTDSDQGSGTLTVSADGTVRLKLESSVFRTGGSDEVTGKMDLTGAVIIDESSQERKIRYDGQFTVKSDPGPRLSGESRLSGGGTYVYDSGAINCTGEFRLHDY